MIQLQQICAILNLHASLSLHPELMALITRTSARLMTKIMIPAGDKWSSLKTDLNCYCQGQQLLGPDGKIYLATYYTTIPNDVFNLKNQNLCVINFPNEVYPLCDFDTNSISLGTRRVFGGLPNMPNYNLGPLVGSGCDT